MTRLENISESRTGRLRYLQNDAFGSTCPVNCGQEVVETIPVKMSTRDGLVRRSAAVLFACSGLITIVNQLVARPAGTHTSVVIGFGILSLLTGGIVFVTFRHQLPWKAPVGVATAFAPLLIGAAAVPAALPDSKVVFPDATLVIAVSTAVAETIAWAMHELGHREEQLATQAMTDPLTGLLNRTAFTDSLTDAATPSSSRWVNVSCAWRELGPTRARGDRATHRALGARIPSRRARRARRARR